MGIKGIPKNHPRHHSSITPRLAKPAEYSVHPTLLPASHGVVHGIQQAGPCYPCPMGETSQPQPTDSRPIQKRQIQGGM